MQARIYHTTSDRLTTSLIDSAGQWVRRSEYVPVPRPVEESSYYKKVQALIECGTECCINCLHLKIENCMVAADTSDVYNYLLVRCDNPRCPTKALKKGNTCIRDLFMGYRFILKQKYYCYE